MRTALGHKGLLRIAAVTGALAVVAGAAVAVASTVHKTVDVPSDTSRTATAKCPGNKEAELGGFTSTVNDFQGTLVNRLDTTSGGDWAARATSLGDDGEVTSFAYCGQTHGLHEVKKGTTLDANLRGSVTARCPSGTSVRLGGFIGGANNEALVVDQLQRVSNRRWKVSATNQQGMGTRSLPLKAIAYCGHGPRLVERTKTVDKSSDPSDIQRGATAHCPAGKEVAMGGFRASHSGQGPFIDVLKRPSKDSWMAAAFKFGAPGAASLTSIAYCGP